MPNKRTLSDLPLAAWILCILGVMIAPLPTFLLDVLLSLNITVAVTLLMVSLYLAEPVRLSSFPSILLVTTLFRLSLNIATTRQILLEGEAGDVIDAFGNFVVQGNIVVGGVVFLIITLVQFVVIAKGSERVSEVAARFTLDAMPGKQMAIDADLRAGAFDLSEAQQRRQEVQQESQLYGAMDGAMKFIKGDAIAGLILTGINILGGITIGMLQKGYSLGEAAGHYTILSIGDGLVSQIPALVLSLTAGMIVTRVGSSNADGGRPHAALGSQIVAQVAEHPKALGLAALSVLLIGALPGLPFWPFFILSVALGGVAYHLWKGGARVVVEEPEVVTSVTKEAKSAAHQTRMMIPAVTPITLVISETISQILGDEGLEELSDQIPKIRETLFFERGVTIPAVHLQVLPDRGRLCEVLVDEIPHYRFEITPSTVVALASAEALTLLDLTGEPTRHPVTGQACVLLDAAAEKALAGRQIEMLSLPIWIGCHLTHALSTTLDLFLTLQMVQSMLEQLEGPYPTTVQETIPKIVTIQMLQQTLKRLVAEGVSIRNLSRILHIIAERARPGATVNELTEHVRQGLADYITYRWGNYQGQMVAYLVDESIEEMITDAVRRDDDGNEFLGLHPERVHKILEAVGERVRKDLEGGRTSVLLTDQRARRFLKRIVELDHPEVVVLSFQELRPTTHVEPIARLALAA